MSASPNKPPVDQEEIAVYDEGVQGRAMRWSAAILIGIVVAAGTGYLVLRRKPAPPAQKVTQLTAPVAKVSAAVTAPNVKFVDVTKSAGIDFVHHNGATGDKLLPETMGGGVAFFDYDNDGAQDLIFINGTDWPERQPKSTDRQTPVLYHNDGKGHFADVTAGSGLEVPIYGMGVAVGDYDNDGLPDVFISAVGKSRLFRNLGGGKFADVTDSTGVGGAAGDWASAATFLDYDNDGRLDLFVGQYVRWTREIDFEVGYKLVGLGRAYGQPMNFQGAFPHLYHNNGDGTFSDTAAKAGLQMKNTATGVPIAKTLGVAPVDLDNDGWMDLVVANDTVQNHVFHNQKDGTFKEVGALTGIAFDSYGATRGAMGIDSGDFRNDGSLGVVIGNFANEMTALYVSQNAPMQFADEAITEGIGPASRLLLKFGVFFFDYDLDGRLDVLSANGHLEQEIGKLQASQHYMQPAQLFWNAGPGRGGCFVPASATQSGGDLFKPIVGRGSAYADIDGDGDLDVIMTQTGGAPLLLRNDSNLANHWVRFKLAGHKSNRSAIGAKITLKAGGSTYQRQVTATRSYLSQSELPVTFGLGKTEKVESVEIVWPGGKKQTMQNVAVDRLTLVDEVE